ALLYRTGQTDWLDTLIKVEIARPEGARSILTVIAGAMIGVASTVFSITIAAVAYASGSYGPRLLTNFMEDRGNQLSLATFIATFVYSVVVLRTIRDPEEVSIAGAAGDAMPGFVPQLSLLVAYGLTAVAVMVLVYFLNHVPASIRVNTVLESIGERLIRDIKQDFAQRSPSPAVQPLTSGRPVTTNRVGYIQIINYRQLQNLAVRKQGRIEMAVRTGDFVHPHMTLACWQGDDGQGELPDEAIRSCFALGGMRTPTQDLHFLIDELVEIGLRALSPGINDPFTAITALHWLGAATAELGQRDLSRIFDETLAAEENRIILLDEEFAHYASRGFGSMRTAVAHDPAAAGVMLETLFHTATMLGDEARRQVLVDEAALLLQQARLELAGPALDLVEDRYRQFRQQMTSG
ncbi:MAG TPA: DUF2254 domain-containing protein, partial [Lautropia sp.]|nr:DUF2254 domain-containing protein [Lautropia sp.]